jgi:nucleoid-associated protein YgaU
MNPTTTLTLNTPQGPFQFAGAEVPEQINFGGAQMLCTHKMIGGLRIVDALGPDDAPLAWSGIFLYEGAAERARFLDYVRRSGLTCTLTWGVFQYAVIVSEFKADFKKPYWIPFSITCEVVRDQTQDVASPPKATQQDAIIADSARMSQLAGAVGIASIAGLAAAASSSLSSMLGAVAPIAGGLVSLSSAASSGSGLLSAIVGEVGQVSSLSNLASSALSSVTGPLAALQSAVGGAIASATAAIASVPSLGNVVAGLPVAGQVAGLVAQCTAAVQLPMLNELSAVTTRIQANVALIASPSSNNVTTTGGGNLYSAAAQSYGDATRWTDIAAASGIADPMMTGFNTITVPQ